MHDIDIATELAFWSLEGFQEMATGVKEASTVYAIGSAYLDAARPRGYFVAFYVPESGDDLCLRSI